MARRVAWTEPALDDLEAVAAYIARDSEHYSVAFVREIIEAAESLADMAERGHVVPELGEQAIREVLVRPYRIVYRIESDRVLILAIVHGALRRRR